MITNFNQLVVADSGFYYLSTKIDLGLELFCVNYIDFWGNESTRTYFSKEAAITSLNRLIHWIP